MEQTWHLTQACQNYYEVILKWIGVQRRCGRRSNRENMQQQALSAIIAWIRLDRAIESFNIMLRRDFGVTGLQLAVLRILAERPALPLAALRKTLVMHPATLGQAVDELRTLGFCEVRTNPKDKRARLVAITAKGTRLLAEAPLAGPVRLRQIATEPMRLERLAAALEDAMELFALGDWAPAAKPAAKRRRPIEEPAESSDE